MTMVTTVVVFTLLAIAVGSITGAAQHHSRFIKAGGQHGFSVVPPSAQTDEMRVHYRRMIWRYVIFMVTLALMLAITAIGGPVVI
jgi:hypothetical protein